MKEVQTTMCIVNTPRYLSPDEKHTQFSCWLYHGRKVTFLNLFEKNIDMRQSESFKS